MDTHQPDFSRTTYPHERRLRTAGQRNAAAFRREADSLEALWLWLGDVWDHDPDECEIEQAEDAERVRRAIEAALEPWRAEIIAGATKRRAELAASGYTTHRALTLFGVTLPPAGSVGR